MPLRKTGAFRCTAFCRAGAGRSRPDRFSAAHPGDERRTGATDKLPGGGLAGAAEDPALLLYAGRKREPPDRPPPGVPQGVFRRDLVMRGFRNWCGGRSHGQRSLRITLDSFESGLYFLQYGLC
jgi:hypothetical protein